MAIIAGATDADAAPLARNRTRTQTAGGITRWVSTTGKPSDGDASSEPPSLRTAMGLVFREHRLSQGLNLREISVKALVSIGYLSEIERGRKEASSEIIDNLCGALDISLPGLLREIAERLDPTPVPDTVESIENSLRKEAPQWAT